VSFAAGRACPAAHRFRPRSADDFLESDRGFLVDAERAAKIQIALAMTLAGLQRHLDGGATDFSVTPAQATRASSSISPEHSSRPSRRWRVEAGYRQRAAVSTLQAMPSLSIELWLSG